MRWEARIEDDFFRGGHRLILFRRLPNGDVEYTTGEVTPFGGMTPTQADPAQHLPRDVGFRLEGGMLNAIAAAAKPGPSEREVALINDALAVERARVDRILDRQIASETS